MMHTNRLTLPVVSFTVLLMLSTLLVQPSLVAAQEEPPNVPPGTVLPEGVTVEQVSGAAIFGRVLLYSDDYVLAPSQHYSSVALQNLRANFVQVAFSPSTFITRLTTESWDCVVIDQNMYGFGTTRWDAVNAYIVAGGKAVVTAWDIDSSLASPLWATLGASWSYVSFNPLTVYSWTPYSSLLSGIPSPWNPTDFTTYNRDAHGMNTLANGIAVAGFTPSATVNQAGLIVRTDGRTILNSFLVADFRANQGRDAVQLFMNEISFVCGVPAVGGTVIEPSPMTGVLALLPWVIMAVVAVGAGAYAMRKRYASPILARIR